VSGRSHSGAGTLDNSNETERERALHDVWSRTLSQISTTFGRVAYLASLRNQNSGVYEHFGLAQRYSEGEADRVLRTSHEAVFAEWLNYSLARQRQDLEEHLRSIEGDRKAVLQTWFTLAPYRNLIPAGSREAERLLYITDLELLLEILRNELSA